MNGSSARNPTALQVSPVVVAVAVAVNVAVAVAVAVAVGTDAATVDVPVFVEDDVDVEVDVDVHVAVAVAVLESTAGATVDATEAVDTADGVAGAVAVTVAAPTGALARKNGAKSTVMVGDEQSASGMTVALRPACSAAAEMGRRPNADTKVASTAA